LGVAKGEAKYTQQLNLVVGDVGGHSIGMYEIHRTNPDFPLPCNQTRVVEEWAHVFVEYAPDSQGTLVPKANQAKFEGEYWFEK
jgi:hypothetical protein